MDWQPPTEDEFNRDWLTPEEALDLLTYDERDTKRRWLMSRLKTEQIIAVARTGAPGGRMEPFPLVPAQYWGGWDEYGDEHFWATGDATFHVGIRAGYSGHKLRFLDIRFDPSSFSGERTMRIPLPPAPPAPPEAEVPPTPPVPRKDISRDDAERFSRAILAGWPDSTEDFAYRKAELFFPDKKVPRDWFKKIFRLIRGPKNRGKQPKTRE